MTRASYFSARAHILSSGAALPSIENTPSVQMMRKRCACAFLRHYLQVGHVGIGVTVTYGFAETHAVDDRGVVQGVGDDGVLLAEERFEDTPLASKQAA